MNTREPRPLYLMTAFGLRNPWVLWSLTRGALDEWCTACGGRGVVARRPCRCTESTGCIVTAVVCRLDAPCQCCREICRECHGLRLGAGDDLLPEDFGDIESRRIAERLFPGLDIDDDPYRVRMDTSHLRGA